MTDQKLIDDVLAAFADREITAPSRDDIARVLEVFETSLRLCGCGACTTARRERIGLTDHDLTSLARVLHEVVYSPGASFDRAVPGIQEHMRACAEKVAAALPWVVPTPEVELVVGEAHTPTDDERTRIKQSNDVAAIVFTEVKKVWPDLHPVLDLRYGIADALWAAGFRRSEEPSAKVIGEWFTSSHGVVVAAVAPMTDRGPAVMVDGRVICPNDVAALIEFKAQGEPSDAQAERARIVADLREWARPLGNSPEEDTLRLVIERIEHAAGGAR